MAEFEQVIGFPNESNDPNLYDISPSSCINFEILQFAWSLIFWN